MKNLLFAIGSCFLVIFGLVSCSTYYISVESFKSQFAEIDSSKMQVIDIKHPWGAVSKSYTNSIKNIKCIDKKDNSHELIGGPSIEIRFTENNNKKTIFYFDTVYLQDTLIVGDRSRFLGLQKRIPIDNVKLIEVQDGKKKYKYVD